MAEVRAYTPTLKERAKALAAQLMGDTRGANEWAAKLVEPMGMLPGIGNAVASHDAARALGQGDYVDAAINGIGIPGGGLTKAVLGGMAARFAHLPAAARTATKFVDEVDRFETPANATLAKDVDELTAKLGNARGPGMPASQVLSADTHFSLYPELENMRVSLPKGDVFGDSPYPIHYRPGFDHVPHNLWIDPKMLKGMPEDEKKLALARALQGAVANIERWPQPLASSSLRPAAVPLRRTADGYREVAAQLDHGVSPEDILLSAQSADPERRALAAHAVNHLQTPEAIKKLVGELDAAAVPMKDLEIKWLTMQGYPIPSHVPPLKNKRLRLPDALYNATKAGREDIARRLYTEQMLTASAKRDVQGSHAVPFSDMMLPPAESVMKLSR